jgi:hypothetical protein
MVSKASSFHPRFSQAWVEDDFSAYRVPHMTPLDPGYAATLQQYQQSVPAQDGHLLSGDRAGLQPGSRTRPLQGQAAILAYMDIFAVCGIAAFARYRRYCC